MFINREKTHGVEMIFMGFLIQFLNRYIPNKGKIEEIMMFRVKNQRVLV
jgi:hypothetical protein